MVKEWGTVRPTTFRQAALGDRPEELDVIDFERGAKLSGSRFYMLKGAGGALCSGRSPTGSWTCTSSEHGFTEGHRPSPGARALHGVSTGNLPKFADALY
ncbi:MAG: hypothetical protein R2851_19585 [Caldilineaceae bacterium]